MQSHYSDYNTGKQPCDFYKPKEDMGEWWGHPVHQCPECGGLRMFCGNCYRDHHKGGWESCKQRVSQTVCQESQ